MGENIAKKGNAWGNFGKKIVSSYLGKLLLATILLCVVMSIASPYFLSITNFKDILVSTSVTGIVSFGMTLVIITGTIDLSVGALVALTSVTLCSCINHGIPVLLSVIVSILASVIVGLLNAFLISKLKINGFIITMGTMNVARGLAYIIIGGRPLPFTAPSIRYLGKGTILGIPISIYLFAIVLIVVWYILKYTQFGRNVYAVGNSPETARLSGINVPKTQTIVFVIMALLSAVAGILLSAQSYAGIPTAGEGYELDAITAVVLGGAAMEGGAGTVLGTLLGTIIVAILMNGLNLLSVPHFYQLVTKGVIVILAMIIAHSRKNK